MTPSAHPSHSLTGLARIAKTRPSAGMSATEAIKQYILDEGLQPGDPLPTEAELCDSLGVSRSSVREAIRTLVSLDIVEVRHGVGTTVGGVSLAPFVNGLVFRSLMNPGGSFSSLRDVVDLREGIDMLVADQLIAAHGRQDDPEREARLDVLVARMRDQNARGEGFMQEDREFHTTLLELGGSLLMQQLVAALWEVHTIVVPQLGITPPEDMDSTVDAHGAMLDAVRAADVEAYRAAVVQHYAPLHRAIARAVDEVAVG
ncbi:FadR/GntR family transcriptional regulator [Propionibacteriaceae bacterium G1746]|uniref:FadR/GntR family transcriptional regulator n=1 Tax=Aestuariimicrobium sp. G57 TaxID=3418485 RepID=UPI003C1B7A76